MKNECQTQRKPSGTFHPIRTLLVDDSTLFLSCLRQLLASQALVRVVGTAANGSEALQKAELLAPDLVLMDLHMPCMDGLQTTVLLRRRQPHTRIIIMTLDDEDPIKAAAYAHGAHGFVGKRRIIDDLMAEIQRVFRVKQAAGRFPWHTRVLTPAEGTIGPRHVPRRAVRSEGMGWSKRRGRETGRETAAGGLGDGTSVGGPAARRRPTGSAFAMPRDNAARVERDAAALRGD